jgi:hypothetical protein
MNGKKDDQPIGGEALEQPGGCALLRRHPYLLWQSITGIDHALHSCSC